MFIIYKKTFHILFAVELNLDNDNDSDAVLERTLKREEL